MTASQSLASEYSGMASAYSALWSPVIAPMARPIFDAIDMRNAERVLDIGTGTGAMLDEIRRYAPDSALAGLDRAEGMLRLARVRGWNSIAVSDGMELAIRSSSIDVALVIFALFHFPDPVRGLGEVRRVLRSDGTAGIVVWGTDPGVPGAAIWTEELNREGAAPDPRDPSVAQPHAMNTPEKLTQLIEEGGLSVVRLWSEWFSQPFTLETLLPLQLGCGVANRRLPSLDESARTRCETRVRERLAMLGPEELNYRPQVLFAVVSPAGKPDKRRFSWANLILD